MKGLVSGFVTETVEPSVEASGLTQELEVVLLPGHKPEAGAWRVFKRTKVVKAGQRDSLKGQDKQRLTCSHRQRNRLDILTRCRAWFF